MEFFVDCTPPRATHHHKKIVDVKLRDGRHFTKLADRPELETARSLWVAYLRPYMPPAPMAPPISLTLEFTWPWRTSDPKKFKDRLERIPCDVKPDCTNAAKTVEDILVGLNFMPGDQTVAELIVRKWIGDRPGLLVRISTIEDVIVRRRESAQSELLEVGT